MVPGATIIKESNSIEVAVLTEPVGCPEIGLVMHQDKAGGVY